MFILPAVLTCAYQNSGLLLIRFLSNIFVQEFLKETDGLKFIGKDWAWVWESEMVWELAFGELWQVWHEAAPEVGDVVEGTVKCVNEANLTYKKYYSSTTKYYSSTTTYYSSTPKYYSVLQSTTPVLLCTTPYYKVLLQYYKVLLQHYSVLQRTSPYYKVLLQYYSVLQSTTTVLQSTTPVLLCTTKYYYSTTKYYSSTTLYYSRTTKYNSTTLYYKVLQSITEKSEMKCHLQFAEQQVSLSNLTK